MCEVRSFSRSGYELSLASPKASRDSDSEFEPGGGGRRKRGKTSDFVRMTSRKKGVVSYKESSHSDVSGGEDGEGVEVGGGEGVEVEDNRDGIERVIKCRPRGESGCHGNIGVIYIACALSTADEMATGEKVGVVSEMEYLIKWKGKSYVHNTWHTGRG